MVGTFTVHKIEVDPNAGNKNPVPRDITEKALAACGKRQGIDSLENAPLEATIIRRLKTLNINDPLIDHKVVEECGDEIRCYLEKIAELEHEMLPDEYYLRIVEGTREELIKILAGYSIEGESLDSLRKVEIRMCDSSGPSRADTELTHVVISKGQVLRRALDYITGDLKASNKQEVIEGVIKLIAAHELGEIFGRRLGYVFNQIPYDADWYIGDNSVEDRAERFAEFWSRKVAERDPLLGEIRAFCRSLEVERVSAIWNALEDVNKGREQGINLPSELAVLRSEMTGVPEAAYPYLDSRALFYSSKAPENYALPYEESQVLEVLPRNSY